MFFNFNVLKVSVETHHWYTLDIFILDFAYWEGSLFGIGWDHGFYLDILWLRRLYYDLVY
jgi:hypothetical protein